MNKFLRLISALIFVLLFAVVCVNKASALGGLDTTAERAGYQENDVVKIGGSVLNVILSFVGVLFLLMMLSGGFIWMTAAGNPGRVELAQKLLVAGIIGLIIAVSAYAITVFIGSSLNTDS